MRTDIPSGEKKDYNNISAYRSSEKLLPDFRQNIIIIDFELSNCEE